MKRYRYRYSLLLFLFALNVAFGQESLACEIESDSITTFDWHPSGEVLMFGSNCGVIGFDAPPTQLVSFLPLERVSELNSIAYSPNGDFLAISRNYIGINVAEVLIWDMDSEALVSPFQDSFSQSPLVWNPIENVLLVGQWGEPRLVSVDSEEIRQRFSIPNWDTTSREPVWFVHLACWSPQGSFVRVFVSQHSFVLTYPQWELASVESLEFDSFRGADCTDDVTALAFPNTSILDLHTQTVIQPDAPCNGVRAVWNPMGEDEFAVNCDDQTVRIYGRDGVLTHRLQGDLTGDPQAGMQRSILFSPSGQWLAALGNNGQFRIWDTSNYELITRVNIADIANLALAQQ